MSGLIPASLLLGVLHGLVLAAVLWRRRHNQRANRYLAGLLIALSALLLDGYLDASGVLAAHPHLLGVAAAVPFLLGPLLWLYVRAMTATEPAQLPRAGPHVVVFASYLALVAVTFYLRSAADKQRFVADQLAGDEPWYVTLTTTAMFVHGFVYVIAALRLLRAHRPHVQSLYSNLAPVGLRWLAVLVALNAVVWAAACALYGVQRAGHLIELGPLALSGVALGSTAIVFFIGYFQLSQAEIFAGQPRVETTLAPRIETALAPRVETALAPRVETASETTVAAPEAAPAAVPYQRARLAEPDAAELEARLRAAMTEQRLYQQPGLTLADLAEAIAATPHELSQVLSTRLGRNFYHFVNEHRIEHVKAALRDAARRDQAVLDLALEAGFASKSTFNAAFRRATGASPRDFRQGSLSLSNPSE